MKMKMMLMAVAAAAFMLAAGNVQAQETNLNGAPLDNAARIKALTAQMQALIPVINQGPAQARAA